MKFVIDIPEREFKGEIADRFQDFFHEITSRNTASFEFKRYVSMWEL